MSCAATAACLLMALLKALTRQLSASCRAVAGAPLEPVWTAHRPRRWATEAPPPRRRLRSATTSRADGNARASRRWPRLRRGRATRGRAARDAWRGGAWLTPSGGESLLLLHALKLERDMYHYEKKLICANSDIIKVPETCTTPSTTTMSHLGLDAQWRSCCRSAS
jgi:hypothetical protein